MKRATFERVGVVANLKKEGLTALLKRVVSDLLSEGFEVFLDEDIEPVLAGDVPVASGIPGDCDLITALGGDGTILNVARRFVEEEIPILGIKAGRLGFLTEPIADDTIARLKSGRYRVVERMRVTAEIKEGDEPVSTLSALNDVVIHGSGYSRMLRFRTIVDGRLLREYSADGVIVATPTGSTAYSLSAGGPLLDPTMEAIIVTPLCPHSLSVRPIVVEASERIEVHVVSVGSESHVTVDGQVGRTLSTGQRVVVKRSEKVTRLTLPEDYDFFNLLREKL